MIKKEHKINPIPNYIDITKVDITKWEDGLYTLGLDKDKGLVIMEKPIYSSDGEGKKALYDDGTYKPTYDKEGIDTLLEGLEQTQNDNLELIKGLENNIKANKGNININKESIEALKDANKVYDKIIENLKTDIKENQNNIININKSITDINEKLDKGSADINEVNEAIFKINNKIIANNKKIEELQTNVNTIKSNIINIEKEISSIKFKIESIDKNYKLADQKIVDDYKKAVGAIREESRSADNEIIKAYKEADQKLYTKLDSDIKDEATLREEADEKLDIDIKDEARLREEADIKLDININKNLQNINQLNDMIKVLSRKDEPIMSAIGGGVVNLPNNAMRSVAPSYKFEGLTLNQLIKNGDFKDGTTGFGKYNCEVTSTKDGIIFQATKQWGWFRQQIEANEKDLIYLAIKLNKPATFVVHINNGANSSIIKNDTFGSRINEYVSQGWGISDSATENWEEIHIKNITSYNLTQTFGAGNEPTKEWCDEHIQGYFEGLKSVQTPMRIKSDVGGRNLIPNSKVYDVSKIGYVDVWFKKPLKKPLKAGTYTISYDEILSSKIPINLPLEGTLLFDNETPSMESIIAIYDKETKSYTFTTKRDHNKLFVYGGLGWKVSNENGIVFSKMKLEEGDIKTPWTPAPEDNLPPQGETLYINNQLELKSVGKVKDYIKDGKLYKNITEWYKMNSGYIIRAREEDGFWIYDVVLKNIGVPPQDSNGLKSSIINKTGIKNIFEYNSGKTWASGTSISFSSKLDSVDAVNKELENNDYYVSFEKSKTEVINLDTTGLITNHPNGTIFIEPITNKTAYYNKGLDISDYNIKEIEYMQIFEENSYQDLDTSKIEIKDNILTHPDIETGIVFISYYYDKNPIYSSNTVDYYNLDNTLKSPDGSIWKKVYEIDNEGKITLKGEKL